jgi:katanin p60 ATPase-containing subunit A1
LRTLSRYLEKGGGGAAVVCKMKCAVDPSPEEVVRRAEEQEVENEYQGLAVEDRKFVPMILSDVVEADRGVSFESVVGCEGAKRLLEEAVILPLVVPQLFVGIRRPWKGVLLYGPPGTGKTMLARAVAGQTGNTFFNCATATLVSKFRGESEKIVKCLFWLARKRAPSVVFLDEVDSLVGSRGGDGEHEASRRCVRGGSERSELVSEAST